MLKNVPDSLVHYIRFLNLKGNEHWELLRKWGLSEVWRVRKASGPSCIIKKGSGVNAREVSIYQHLLKHFRLPVPEIYDSYTEEYAGLLMLEDLQGQTLEQVPSPSGYETAAKTLAAFRMRVADSINHKEINSSKYDDYIVEADKYMKDLEYISMETAFMKDGQARKLKEAINLISSHVNHLYKHYPTTLTHNDYHSKNLIRSNGFIYVIDWASAYLSPHLGDLYCLIRSAKENRIDPESVLQAYREESDGFYSKDLTWQVCIGGICWLIDALRNLLDEGIKFIPAAVDWIPDLINDLIELSVDLEHYTICPD